LGYRRRGLSDEAFGNLGVEPRDLDELDAARARGMREEFGDYVTDAMVDAIFVAGDPVACRERLVDVCATARANGFGQIMFSELGPNAEEAVDLICNDLAPVPHLNSS
jgi:hypothetical protein